MRVVAYVLHDLSARRCLELLKEGAIHGAYHLHGLFDSYGDNFAVELVLVDARQDLLAAIACYLSDVLRYRRIVRFQTSIASIAEPLLG